MSKIWRPMVRLCRPMLLACGLLLSVVCGGAMQHSAKSTGGHTAAQGASRRPVWVLRINGGIGPAVQAYVEQGLKRAQQAEAQAVVLQMDTPGGLGSAMRGIIQAMLQSPLPVVGYVAPSGARAASAGTFLVYASALVGMAPGTHLGAATPVSLGGGGKTSAKPEAKRDAAAGEEKATAETKATTDKSKVVDQQTAMRQKATYDAVAFIRSLAQMHRRNIDFAERAVTEAATLTATEAKAQGVINVVARDIPALLHQLQGRRAWVAGRWQQFHLKPYRLFHYQPSWKIKFLTIITAPSIAYLLLIAGAYGLFLEFSHPGMVAPGVIGGISLLLGLYALQLLPINYVGLALLALGVGLMIAEALMPSVGVLGVGGVIAFAIGSMMLINTEHPGYQIAKTVVVLLSLLSAAFFIGVGRLAMRSRKRPVVSGVSPLLGVKATVKAGKDGHYYVFLQSERWRVHADQSLQAGDHVQVVAVHGVLLKVEVL